jgi:hypothetical protein
MRTIKTYSKGAPFYNAFIGTWVHQPDFSLFVAQTFLKVASCVH